MEGFCAAAASLILSGNPSQAAASSAFRLRQTGDRRSLDGLDIRNGQGAATHVHDYAGRVAVLNMWAPWCVPCRREMPSLSRLKYRLADAAVDILPVSFDWRGPEGVQRFYLETGVENLPVLQGEGQNLLAVSGKSNLPLTLVADKAGFLNAFVEGEAVWDDAATESWLRGLAA